VSIASQECKNVSWCQICGQICLLRRRFLQRVYLEGPLPRGNRCPTPVAKGIVTLRSNRILVTGNLEDVRRVVSESAGACQFLEYAEAYQFLQFCLRACVGNVQAPANIRHL
jgi:hypothetical protein